jgi:hypothetical protein
MSTSNKKKVAAADLMNKLLQDPEYRAKAQESEKRRKVLKDEHRLAAWPVIQELKQAGFEIESIDELRRSGHSYKPAIRVLLNWLPRIQNPGVKESIVRALSVPWARPAAARPLICAFQAVPSTDSSALKWAIGNALEIVADDSVFSETVQLVRDKQHGKAREMLAVALGNMTNPAAVDILIDLLDDEEIAGHALIGLGKLRAQKARPYIEAFLNHPKPWVRKEASKALARLNKVKRP